MLLQKSVDIAVFFLVLNIFRMFKDVFISIYAFCLCPLLVMWCLSITEGCAVASHVATGGVSLWANWTTCAKDLWVKPASILKNKNGEHLDTRRGRGLGKEPWVQWNMAEGKEVTEAWPSLGVRMETHEGSEGKLINSIHVPRITLETKRKRVEREVSQEVYAVPEKQWHLPSTIVVAEQEEVVSFCINVFIL